MNKQSLLIIKKYYIQFCISGLVYVGLETLFRLTVNHKQTHPVVLILGGVGYLIGSGVARLPIKKVFVWVKPLLGAILLTAWEFVFGLFFNTYLGFDIWSYRGLRYQFMGQISLLFSLIWVVIMLIIMLVDYILENRILKDTPYSFRALKLKRPKRA